MLRQSPFSAKGHPMLSFRFCFLGGGVDGGLDINRIFWISSSEWKLPASEDVSHPLTLILFIGGVEIGDSFEGSCDWALSFLSH